MHDCILTDEHLSTSIKPEVHLIGPESDDEKTSSSEPVSLKDTKIPTVTRLRHNSIKKPILETVDEEDLLTKSTDGNTIKIAIDSSEIKEPSDCVFWRPTSHTLLQKTESDASSGYGSDRGSRYSGMSNISEAQLEQTLPEQMVSETNPSLVLPSSGGNPHLSDAHKDTIEREMQMLPLAADIGPGSPLLTGEATTFEQETYRQRDRADCLQVDETVLRTRDKVRSNVHQTASSNLTTGSGYYPRQQPPPFVNQSPEGAGHEYSRTGRL